MKISSLKAIPVGVLLAIGGCGESRIEEDSPRVISNDIHTESIGVVSSSEECRAVAGQKLDIHVHLECEGKVPEHVIAKVLKLREGKRPMSVQSGTFKMKMVENGKYELRGALEPIRDPGTYQLQVLRKGEVFAETTLEVTELR